MTPSSAAVPSAKVVALPPTPSRRRSEAEFLPAALEIIETPASPAGRAIALTIVGFLAAGIAWSCIGQVDIIATAQGRVIPTGKSKVIQPFETGVVRRIAVADGSAVKAGDVLVELDPTSDASDETRLVYTLSQDALDIARLRALIAGDSSLFTPPADADPQLVLTAQRHMQAQASEHEARLEGLDRQIAQKTAEGREIVAAIDKLTATQPMLQEQLAMRQRLVDNQFGSRLQLLQIEQQVVENAHDLEGQRQRKEENVQALAALARQRAETQAEYAKGLFTDLAKARVSAKEHEEEIRKAVLKRELRTLRAPVAGTVQQLAVHTLGGVVSPGEQLMVIVPEGEGLEIEADLANKDVGFVHEGQEVEVKVEAFTFTRYGLLHGHVINVSQDTVAASSNAAETSREARDGRESDDASDASDRSRQSAYVAHVALAGTSIMTEQGARRLGPGMAVTAEIRTGRRTVVSYLLSPLQRLRQEGLRER